MINKKNKKKRLLQSKDCPHYKVPIKLERFPEMKPKPLLNQCSMLTVRIWREDEVEELLSRAPCCSRGI